MDIFKDLSEKAKHTAKMVGEISSDMVEIGKLRLQITNLENEIRRLKTEIGQHFYKAYSEDEEIPYEKILSICEEIKEKYAKIEEIREKIDSISL
mgnify:FL=1